MPVSQVMGLHSRTMKKFVQRFNALEEGKISAQLGDKEIVSPEMEPVVESLDKELVSMLCLKVCSTCVGLGSVTNYLSCYQFYLWTLFWCANSGSQTMHIKQIKIAKKNLRMAQGMKCLHAIWNYMRKVKLKYQHVFCTNTRM